MTSDDSLLPILHRLDEIERKLDCILEELRTPTAIGYSRSEEHTSELQSQSNLVCRLLLEKKNTAVPRVLDLLQDYPLARFSDLSARIERASSPTLRETCGNFRMLYGVRVISTWPLACW